MVFGRVERVERVGLEANRLSRAFVREGLRAGEILTQSAENRR